MLDLNERQQKDMLRAIEYFFSCDTDKSGVIDRAEFEQVYKDLTDCEFDLEPIDECFQELDIDGNGVISFNEYVGWLAESDFMPSMRHQVPLFPSIPTFSLCG